MQPLLGGDRSNLTIQQVTEILQSDHAIQITYGARGLDENFDMVADLSDHMVAGSTISSDCLAAIHRTCSIGLQSDVQEVWDYLSGYIAPYMVITDQQTGAEATFNLGVYTLTTPSRSLTTSPSIATYSGYDLLQLLTQPLDDSYEVPAGSDPVQAASELIEALIPGVTATFTPSGVSLPAAMSFPFDAGSPATYRSVVTALLNAAAYQPVWVNWDGEFQIEPFFDPAQADPEWKFDINDENTIVAEGRDQALDIYSTPNWFRFTMEGLAAPPVEGLTMLTYLDSLPDNPGSTSNRGRRVRYVEQVTAADFASLQAYAVRKIQSLLKPSEIITAHTQPFPAGWHFDVFSYSDPNLADVGPLNSTERKVLATNWSLPLDGQSDMDWVWQVITQQTVEDLHDILAGT